MRFAILFILTISASFVDAQSVSDADQAIASLYQEDELAILSESQLDVLSCPIEKAIEYYPSYPLSKLPKGYVESSLSVNSSLHDLGLKPSAERQFVLDRSNGLVAIIYSFNDLAHNMNPNPKIGFEGKFVLPVDVSLVTDPVAVDGYIDICQGESVSFSADVDYQGGGGSDATSIFQWTIIGEYFEEGVGEDFTTFEYTFDNPSGYQIKVFVEDENGDVNSDNIIVRVSTTPDFSGVVAQFNDTICLGDTTRLIGSITDSQLSFGVFPTEGLIETGGTFGDTLVLPDGGATDVPPVYYSTPIEFCAFEPGQTLQSANDLESICMTIEHSWVSDLEIWVTCPDGTDVLLVDGYEASGAGIGQYDQEVTPLLSDIFFGEAIDTAPDIPTIADAGIGYEYCFVPDATIGDFQEAHTADTLVDGGIIVSGDYSPQGDFSDFVGCPLNGTWNLWVGDYWDGDDGWIFEWSVNFTGALAVDTAELSYFPVLLEGEWADEPSIVLDNDTIIDVSPSSPGDYQYSFVVTDNFGCAYDTTVVLTVLPQPFVSAISPGCFLSSEVTVENSYQGGFWTAVGPTEDSPFPLLPVGSGEVLAFEPGDYTLTYTDFFCDSEQSVDIYFPPPPIADIMPDSMIICFGFSDELSSAPQPDGLPVSYLWQYDSLGFQLAQSLMPFVEVSQPGLYTLSVTDAICNITVTDLLTVEAEICEIEVFNVFSPNGDGLNDYFYIEAIDKFQDPVVYVYNRWGNLIYEKKNYQNNWDMEGLTEGTYYYVVLNPQMNETFKGHFTLVR